MKEKNKRSAQKTEIRDNKKQKSNAENRGRKIQTAPRVKLYAGHFSIFFVFQHNKTVACKKEFPKKEEHDGKNE